MRAKTICSDFDEQSDISEELYGTNLRFGFTKADVSKLLAEAAIYSEKERSRVEQIVFAQMRKYKYLFLQK